ncbi:MAG: PAS domain S-box protein [Gemmatimonadota bacterium]
MRSSDERQGRSRHRGPGASSSSRPGSPQSAREDPPTEGSDRFRLIFDHAYQFLGLLAPDGTLLEVNRSALEFGALAREDVVGRPFWDTGWWSTDPPAQERLRGAVRSAAAGEFVRYEAEVRGKGDERAVVDFSLQPVLGTNGQVVAIVPEGRVITALKATEEELRLSRAKFAGILRGAADAIISIDESQHVELFNEGAERIFGYSREEVLGQPLGLLIPERLRKVHDAHVQAFAGSEDVARLMGEREEIIGLRKGGEEFPAEASIQKVEVAGRKVLTVILRDTSDRKRIEAEREHLLAAEQEARRRAEATERRAQFLAEASRQLAGSLDLNETLASLAELSVPMLGDVCVVHATERGSVSRARVVARPGLEIGALEMPEVPAELTAAHPVREVMETGEPALFPELGETELARLAVDDEDLERLRRMRPGSLMILPLAARGATLGALCFLTVGGERRLGPAELALARELADRASLAVDNARLYGAARQATRTRDEMFHVISHDLKNPLAAILLGVKMLRARAESDADLAELLEGIELSAAQLDRQVRDLMDVAGIETGRLLVQPRPVAPEALLDEATRALEPRAAAAGVSLSCEAEPGLPSVSADRARIVQALSNLVDNGIKFTPAGGAITVRAVARGRRVEISVSDTGPGVAVEDQPYVFDRFWHGAGPAGADRSGIGLGLFIVRGIVEQHGGAVNVRSRPGEGATFTITLPVARE